MRVFICYLLAFGCSAATVNHPNQPRVLAFEARDGRYVSHGPGYSLSVTSRAAVVHLGGRTLRMWVAGSSSQTLLDALDRMPGKANYFPGGDVRASYALYGRVRWRDAYPGIDVLFRGNQDHLEYDFEIAARRDPRKIRIAFEGVDEIRVDAGGALVLRAGDFEIRQPVPIAWQIKAGQRVPVSVHYQVDRDRLVAFRIDAYNPNLPLVIDPQLVFDNMFGGSGTSSAAGVAIDSQGNIYVAGQTNSADFPVQSATQNLAGAAPLLASSDGGQTWVAPSLGASASVRSLASSPGTPLILYAATSIGVIKSSDGGITWTTPANTGLSAPPAVVAVDAGSSATVYAATNNRGIFVSNNGGANWSASNGLLIPGSTPPSPPQLYGLVASPTQPGVAFAIAQSPDFLYRTTDAGQTWAQVVLPVAGGSPSALVFSPSDTNTLYLGQQTGAFLRSSNGGTSWTSLGNQTVQNPQGLAILPGSTPVLLAANRAALSRSSDGGSTWTTVLPLNFGVVAADPRTAGVAYAADSSAFYHSSDGGLTWSKAALPYIVSPVTLFVSAADSRVFAGENSQLDAFITKWSPDGSRILYSTYLGGSGSDSATGIAVDSAGSAYVTGTTSSQDFPVSKNAFQKTLGGGPFSRNAFVSKLSPDGSQLMYSTLLGGGNEVTTRIAVDRAGAAVIAGGTDGTGFPVTAGAFQSAPVASCSIQSPFVLTAGSAFVSKIAADGGSLVFSTLLGGSCATRAQAVAIDAGGNAWVGGFTDSPDFPVTKDALQPELGGNVYDGFLVRFSPSGSLSYASYVGGKLYDIVTGIAFDPKGNVYLTGTSGGLSQSASPGAVQGQVTGACIIFSIGPGVYQATGSAFVLKLDPDAHSTLGLTYLGSPLCLYPSDIAVDAAGAPWIAGNLSPNGSAPQTALPLQIGFGSGFVSKFSPDFTKMLFSTYFDGANGIALDAGGLAYVAGAGSINNATGTSQGYVAKIDPAPPAISLDAVQNVLNPASPSNLQGITGGEVLRILGKNMGPAQATPGIVDGGLLASTVAGVQVTFDGVAAPLLSVSAGEIDLVAPFELVDKTAVTVQVRYQGVTSNAVNVATAVPVNFAGAPPGIPVQVLGVYNEDFSVNSANNPARAGSVMTLYVSGIGQSVPPSSNGQINSAPLPGPPAPVRIVLPGGDFNNPATLPVTFAGAASGLAAGIFQVNFVAPPQSVSNLSLLVGQAGSLFGVVVRP